MRLSQLFRIHFIPLSSALGLTQTRRGKMVKKHKGMKFSRILFSPTCHELKGNRGWKKLRIQVRLCQKSVSQNITFLRSLFTSKWKKTYLRLTIKIAWNFSETFFAVSPFSAANLRSPLNFPTATEAQKREGILFFPEASLFRTAAAAQAVVFANFPPPFSRKKYFFAGFFFSPPRVGCPSYAFPLFLEKGSLKTIISQMRKEEKCAR